MTTPGQLQMTPSPTGEGITAAGHVARSGESPQVRRNGARYRSCRPKGVNSERVLANLQMQKDARCESPAARTVGVSLMA